MIHKLSRKNESHDKITGILKLLLVIQLQPNTKPICISAVNINRESFYTNLYILIQYGLIIEFL